MSTTPEFVEAGAAGSMKAWVLRKAGDVKELEVAHVTIPVPGPQQVRVKIMTATTNPIDYKHAGMEGQSAFPAVFGCDGAGIVDAVGGEVTNFKVGDRVHYFGNVFAAFGTYAEYGLADSYAIARIPEGMDWDAAGVVPCAYWTAYEALFDRMNLKAGHSLFVAAGAGGVGHFAIQLGKNAGAKVITSASGANVERLRGEGYIVVDYRNENVREAILKATDGVGVDCAFDMLATEESALETMQAVRFGGQYTHIAMGVPSLPGGGGFINALTVHHVFTPGNVIRPEQAARFVAIADAANKLVVDGTVKPEISKTFNFDGVKDALVEHMGGRCRGKMLIKIGV